MHEWYTCMILHEIFKVIVPLNVMLKIISVNLDDIMWKHMSHGICRLDEGVQFIAIRQLSGSNDLDTILVCQHTWPAFQQNKNKPFPKRVLGCFVQINGFFWLRIRPSIPNTTSRMPKTLPLTVIAKLTNFVSSSQFRWYIETSVFIMLSNTYSLSVYFYYLSYVYATPL